MTQQRLLLAITAAVCLASTTFAADALKGEERLQPEFAINTSRLALETITFESVTPGTIVEPVFGSLGSGPVIVTGHNKNLDLRFPSGINNAAAIFDSAAPPGVDLDLGTPNQAFGGPGIGAGGASGPYANTVPHGHILIVNVASQFVDRNASGNITTADSPVTQTNDDDIAGSSLIFDFAAIGPVTIYSIAMIDNEALEPNLRVALYNAAGSQIGAVFVGPPTGNNGVAIVPLGPTPGVTKMIVRMDGSGAIDDIVFGRPICGNGIVNTGEACDDGNTNNNDACSNNCTQGCGNGIVNTGEQCDDGNANSNDACSTNCTQGCGNGIVNTGEACDDGNQNNNDACSTNCTQGCGNGIVNTGEACDDGNANNNDACSNNCTQGCGNGIVNTGEACDDGNQNNNDACSNNCTQGCGNGVVNTGEACDDGNQNSNDACSNNCTQGCGNGIVNTGEACDDGNQNNNDACSNNCTQGCGNGIINTGEACDDGNQNNNDACSSNCTAGCGNGIVNAGEACDDGNTDNNDACSNNCTSACGNGIVNTGEACDDGNTNDNDACSNTCTAGCGNGIINTGEMCDDANQNDNDACSNNCTAGCGNGVVNTGEMCDDANQNNNDACSNNCTSGCGNGIVNTGEQCDDGSSDDGDGCSSNCLTESIACRMTGGGNDTRGYWDHSMAEGEMTRGNESSSRSNGANNLLPGTDRYTFGGQAGAPTALPPQPSGEWTHYQQRGPSGYFEFHGGTSSAPAGTEVGAIRCSDPGFCQPARHAPAQQVDFAGVGTFRNIGKGAKAPVWLIPIANVTDEGHSNQNFDGTYHWFEVNVDDMGEPGSRDAPDSTNCPDIGFGEKGATPLAHCGCPDFYRITIYNGVTAAELRTSGPNKTDVIYEVYGYISGGNLQIHPPTGHDQH